MSTTPAVQVSIVDTSGKFATGNTNNSYTSSKVCRQCRWPLVHLHLWISLWIFKKNFNVSDVTVFSGAWGKMIHEKTLKQKVSWHCPFNTSTNKLGNSMILQGGGVTSPLRPPPQKKKFTLGFYGQILHDDVSVFSSPWYFLRGAGTAHIHSAAVWLSRPSQAKPIKGKATIFLIPSLVLQESASSYPSLQFINTSWHVKLKPIIRIDCWFMCACCSSEYRP